MELCIDLYISIPVSGIIRGDLGRFKLINPNINLGFALEGSFINILVQIFVFFLLVIIERMILNGKKLFEMRH